MELIIQLTTQFSSAEKTQIGNWSAAFSPVLFDRFVWSCDAMRCPVIPCEKFGRAFVAKDSPLCFRHSKFATGNRVRLLDISKHGGGSKKLPKQCRSGVRTVAMVNVELTSPSLILGIALIAGGVGLFSVRKSNPKVSRDSDVVVSSLITVTGGALVFQGWRLDPLLLLCQVMTCSVALWFALESLKLRDEVQDQDVPRDKEIPKPQQESNFFGEEEEWFGQESRFRGDVGLPPPQSTFNEWSGRFPESNWQNSERAPNVSQDPSTANPAGSLGTWGPNNGDYCEGYDDQQGANGQASNAGGEFPGTDSGDKGNDDAGLDTGGKRTQRSSRLLESIEDWE